MLAKLLYTKRFLKEPIWEDPVQQQKAGATNDSQPPPHSLSEMIAALEEKTTYTPLPNRIKNREKFIQAAIELSEVYELDVDIVQQKGAVCATYLLDYVAAFRNINPLMTMGDEFFFSAHKNGLKISFSVTYYTHQQERNGYIMAP